MAHTLIDIYNHILKYDDKEVYIALHSKTNEPYFNAKQICEMLNYVNYHKAIREHVLKEDIFYLKDIVKNYKSLYKNVQGHTKFLNEAGLYTLILRSKKPNATEFFNWITHDVMPSLRKYGQYKTNTNIRKQINELNKQIEEKTSENKILKHNLQKPKIKEGKLVYILRTIENTTDLDVNEKIFIKFGKTTKFKPRKAVYDTGNKNRVQILKSILVNDPDNIERCVIKKMEDYKIMHGKEYFECSYNEIIDKVAKCIKFYEERKINKKPEIKLSRTTNIFNANKQMKIEILTDEEFDKLFENVDNEDSDTDNLLSSDESDNESIINNQTGGGINFYLEYMSLKLKYLELKYDLL